MGCKSSSAREPIHGHTHHHKPHVPLCHFCKKAVPEREFNAHTVQCDAREVTCWHSWCRTIVKQGQLAAHMEECGKKRKAICVKCGEAILSIEMASHRDNCQLVQCVSCSEAVIGRIVKYCPVKQLEEVKLNVGPFATEALRQRHPRELDLNVARIQHLFRWHQTKSALEDIVFRSMYKEIDAKKEGFAIFKAHDKVTEAHVLASKKSRSLVQLTAGPSAVENYFFPTSRDTPITMDHVQKLILELRKGQLPPTAVAWRILNETYSHLQTISNIQLNGGGGVGAGGRTSKGMWFQGSKTIVVGDLHGQLADLLYVLNDNGMPSETTRYVFNGDFVDRGAQGMEVILILFSLTLAAPTHVSLNRGNHECDYMNEEYGFDVEVSTKYDRAVYRLVQRCFTSLPLATIVHDQIFVVHGGLPRRQGVTLDDVRRIQRFRQIPMPELQQPEEDEIFQDLVWSDPWEQRGWRDSDRGAGVQFGADITNEFLKLNRLKLVVRSHEEFAKGYEEHHNKKLLTVFTASNYDGPDTNKGAIVVFVGDNVEPSFVTHHVEEDEYDMPEDPSSPTLEHTATLHMTRSQSFGGGLHSSFASRNVVKNRVSPKDEVLRSLRDRIYQRRHRLLAYFTKLDRTQKGSVWKIEWVEAMRNCLNLELPWFFLRRYLADEDGVSHRIYYADFLSRFHSGLTKLWLTDWQLSMSQQIKLQLRVGHRHNLIQQTFADQKVNYNAFCSAMRTIDYTLTDAQLFQLFIYFDADASGHIDGNIFLLELDSVDPKAKAAARWELDAMEQLQNITIQGRSQLASLFKITSKDRILTREKYLAGMALLSRSMKKQITKTQQESIFNFVDKKQEGKVTYDRFLHAFSVYDIDSQAHPLQRSVSGADFHGLATPTSTTGKTLPRFPGVVTPSAMPERK